MMAVISISHDDIIEAEFETVSNSDKAAVAPISSIGLSSAPATKHLPVDDELSLLRDQFSDSRQTSQPDELSPTFLAITLICAFIVFWVSGGHALMY